MAIVDGSTSSQYWDYRVVATELSRNIASNYTRIRFDVQITRIGSSSYIQGQGSISLTVNDKADGGNTTYSSGTISYNINPAAVGVWHTIWSKEVNIYHSSNGTKTCSISSSWSNNVSPSSGSASGNFSVTSIPRTAAITLSVLSTSLISANIKASTDVSVSKIEYRVGNGGYITASTSSTTSYSFTISGLSPGTEYTITVRVTRKDSGLTSEKAIKATTKALASLSGSLNYTLGQDWALSFSNPGNGTINLSIKIADGATILRQNVSNPYTFSPIAEELDAMYAACPNTNTPNISFVVTTLLNGSSVGTKSQTGKAAVVNSNPAFPGFSVQDSNPVTAALTGNTDKFIKGHSTAGVSILPASGQNHATIVRYIISDGLQSAVATDLSGSLANVEGTTITVAAVDSRGNQTLVSKIIDMIDYTGISANPASADRANGADEETVLTLT